MTQALMYGFLAALAVSAVSLIGVGSLSLSENRLKFITPFFLCMAAGAMVGNALFHLAPEAFEYFLEAQGHDGLKLASLLMVGGFFGFFAIDLILHSVGKHDTPHEQPIGYLILLGDALENLVDGIVIGSAFMIGPEAGIATTIAIIVHEIPIELGDFAVLIHAGFTRTKALLWNLVSGMVSLFGIVIANVAGSYSEAFPHYMGPIAAGALLFMAGASLVPAIRQDAKLSKVYIRLLIAVAGAGMMWLLLAGEHAH